MKSKATEIWRTIPGVRYYEASSYGKIRSLDRSIRRLNRWGISAIFIQRGRVLKPWVGNSGYQQINIGNKASVHRLVALAFLGKPARKQITNHLNGMKTDNRPENLEWTTYKKNTIHSRSCLMKRGKAFTVKQVISIIKLAHRKHRVVDLAVKYKICRQSISSILSGKRWACRDYPEIAAARRKYPYVSPQFGVRWRQY